MRSEEPPEPWKSLLQEVDRASAGRIELHCIGGFALEIGYGLSRTTLDLDFLAVKPFAQARFIEQIAGRGSELAKKYGVYPYATSDSGRPLGRLPFTW